MSSNNNTPHLRFPEFTGEWDEKTFGDVGDFVRGLSYNKGEVTTDETSTLVIRSNNVIQDGNVDCKNGLQFVTKTPSSEQVLKKGDIVICLSNGSSNLVGKSASFDGEYSGVATVGAFCGIYRSSAPITKYLVQTQSYKKSIDLIKQGGNGALANLYGRDVLGLKFFFPPHAEQQKITSCLSEVDNLISAQGQKVETLQEQKKGLMQQLFPQQGESTPRLRFPGFSGEWEEKKLGEVCILINGMAFKPTDWKSTGIPIVRIQNINNSKAPFNYCDPEIVDKRCLIDNGTLLFSWSGTPGAYIWNRGKAALNQHIFIVKPIGIHILFLKSSIDSNMPSIIEKSHGGAGLRHITKSDLEDIRIIVPIPSEQQKIAECLSSLDDLIAAETAKLDTLKDHKKGLMQQLFPQTSK